MRAFRLLAAALVGLLLYQAFVAVDAITLSTPVARAATNTFSNTAPIVIPDSGSANPYPSRILVTSLVGPVTKVTVTVTGFAHSCPDDVGMLLVSPLGTNLNFFSLTG